MRIRTTLLAVAVLAPASEVSAQRLPQSVNPSHYDLTFDVNLANARFKGDETIRVAVTTPTADVTLNAAEIRFNAVTISTADGERRAVVRTNDALEQATFTVDRPLPAGAATIHITYTGTLNDQLRGL